MDKALVFGTKDCRFESCQGHSLTLHSAAQGDPHRSESAQLDFVPCPRSGHVAIRAVRATARWQLHGRWRKHCSRARAKTSFHLHCELQLRAMASPMIAQAGFYVLTSALHKSKCCGAARSGEQRGHSKLHVTAVGVEPTPKKMAP